MTKLLSFISRVGAREPQEGDEDLAGEEGRRAGEGRRRGAARDDKG